MQSKILLLIMHKLVIQIQGLNNNKKSPFRKLIQEENDNIIHDSSNNESEFRIKQPFNRNEKNGVVHLYKKYDGSIKEIQMQHKSSLVANQIQIKTQVLFFNRLHSSQLKSLLLHIQQRQSEIDFFDMIWEKDQQSIVNIIIYFNSILTSEEFFQLAIFKFHTLAIYIKQTIIISKENQKGSKQLLKYAQLQQQKAEKQGKDLVYTQKWVQIPLCIACLQKLQYEITGIPIQFLHQIKDNCKQCKTCETILKINRNQQTNCQLCQSTEDNWICMVCNKIGCGRYKNADAFKHFQEQGHIMTLDLQTQRVWNYMSDCFSHRVIPLQKEEVTLRFPEMNNKKNIKYEQSLENAFWEYCSVVSEELQRQRKYYQKQKFEQEEKFKRQNSKLDNLMNELMKQVELKDQTIKKIHKKNNKNQKRLTQLKQKIKMDRQTLSNYQKMIKQENKQQTLDQIQKNSPKIQQKLKIKADIQKEIQSILMKLSQY